MTNIRPNLESTISNVSKAVFLGALISVSTVNLHLFLLIGTRITAFAIKLAALSRVEFQIVLREINKNY